MRTIGLTFPKEKTTKEPKGKEKTTKEPKGKEKTTKEPEGDNYEVQE